MGYLVFIGEFLQESNTFNPILTDFEDFASYGILEGDELVCLNGKADPTIKGMLTACREYGFQTFGGIGMRSKSGGPVESGVAEWFLDKTLQDLENMGSVDIVLLSLHGATHSEKSGDVCGDFLAAVRQQVGQNAVIAASCDLHGNITQRMLENADFICGYQTYPHLDYFSVGYRAASLAGMKLLGRKLKTALVRIPMMAPAHGYTTAQGGLRDLMEFAQNMVDTGEIVDYSIFQVQPWLDVPQAMSAVVVVAEEEEKAKQTAFQLAQKEFALREELQGNSLWTIQAVVEAAIQNETDMPVVLVDSADSPNAGASGDSAALLKWILPYRESLRTAISLNDMAAVEKAFFLGVGGQGDFELGASIAPRLSDPVTVKNAIVRSLHDGHFWLGGPAERGQKRSMGKSAVIQAGEILILLTQRGQNNGDVQFYRSFGIEPTLCRLVCVKACTSFRAGYEPIAAKICNTTTPGAAGPVLTALPYENLPEPFYPFQEISEADITAPVCYR